MSTVVYATGLRPWVVAIGFVAGGAVGWFGHDYRSRSVFESAVVEAEVATDRALAAETRAKDAATRSDSLSTVATEARELARVAIERAEAMDIPLSRESVQLRVDTLTVDLPPETKELVEPIINEIMDAHEGAVEAWRRELDARVALETALESTIMELESVRVERDEWMSAYEMMSRANASLREALDNATRSDPWWQHDVALSVYGTAIGVVGSIVVEKIRHNSDKSKG